MRKAVWKRCWLSVFLIELVLRAAAAPVCSSGSVLGGTVLDPARAAVVGARVTMQPQEGRTRQTRTDAEGHFEFPCSAPHGNIIHVEASGFAPEDINASSSALAVQLSVAPLETSIAVGDDKNSFDTDHGADTHILTGKDVQDLADDPDDLKRQLQVLAATSGGTPGQAIITVDGFQNSSQLPPKSSIASIRVNPDMFSSEYEEPPYRGGRIEIYTKPGLDRYHGALFYTDSHPVLNANIPFQRQALRPVSADVGLN